MPSPFTLADLEYDLPPERIAQAPLPERDAARLLLLHRGRAPLEHRRVRELPDLLPAGAVLAINDTRVLPARLLGLRAATGGKCEVLLVRRIDGDGPRDQRWTALLQTRGTLRPGETLTLGDLRAVYRHRQPDGEAVLDLSPIREEDRLEDALQRCGAMPLPPYIRRPPDPADRERYQTVYAREPGAVAAPTAGLHLTDALLDALAARGHAVARITLHVGPGTFRPITAPRPEAHRIGAERMRVTPEAAECVSRARREGRPVIAVGTTVVRALESAAEAAPPGGPAVVPFDGDTSLYVLPGHRFRAVDGLLTNFHLPRSTLLGLVMAFHGREPTRAAYAEAVRSGYRFYSYGDAMLILPQDGSENRGPAAD